MIDILKLRSVGLSLKDTKQAMYGVDFKEIVASLHDQMDEYVLLLICGHVYRITEVFCLISHSYRVLGMGSIFPSLSDRTI